MCSGCCATSFVTKRDCTGVGVKGFVLIVFLFLFFGVLQIINSGHEVQRRLGSAEVSRLFFCQVDHEEEIGSMLA